MEVVGAGESLIVYHGMARVDRPVFIPPSGSLVSGTGIWRGLAPGQGRSLAAHPGEHGSFEPGGRGGLSGPEGVGENGGGGESGTGGLGAQGLGVGTEGARSVHPPDLRLRPAEAETSVGSRWAT